MSKLYEILDNNNYNINSSDINFIILWKENKKISETIEEHFKNNIIDIKYIKNLLIEERYNIICKIYNNNDFEKDNRTYDNKLITIYVIKDKNPIYKIIKRGRTTEPRNINIFNFKHEILNIERRSEWMHSSDNTIEGYFIINAFKLDKYNLHTPYTFLDVNILKVAVWSSWPHIKDKKPYNYKLTCLCDTSQFKYLNNNKEPYINFIKNCDPRPLDDFNKLIKNFDYNNYNNVMEQSKLVNVGISDNNEIIIIDGCHRASLLLYHNIKYIKVYIRNIKYPFYNIN